MGAHTLGKNHGKTSLFHYVWVSRGTQMFNNDYYKMITDETRWYFNDNVCTKAGDAYGNRPMRRWIANYRFSTHNKGPVFWMSENYVCPNCVRFVGFLQSLKVLQRNIHIHIASYKCLFGKDHQ